MVVVVAAAVVLLKPFFVSCCFNYYDLPLLQYCLFCVACHRYVPATKESVEQVPRIPADHVLHASTEPRQNPTEALNPNEQSKKPLPALILLDTI